MASTFTTNTHLELQGTGDNSGTWGSELNTAVFTIVDNVFGNVQTVSLSSTDVTLNTAQTQVNFIKLTGVLTANVNVIFPAIGRTYLVQNNTTGSFTVTLKIGAGASTTIVQTSTAVVVMDGTNVYSLAIDGANLLGFTVTGSKIATGTIPTGKLSAVTGSGTNVVTDVGPAITNAALTTPTATTPTTGDSSTKVATTAFVAATAIGVAQTWQDVKSSRANNTSFQNTTGKPIMVSVSGSSPGNWQLQVSSDNATWISIGINNNVAQTTAGAIIPVNWYYRTVNFNIGTWVELR